MALPLNISKITVTGTFIDFKGLPVVGQVKFRINQVLIDALSDVIIIPSVLTVDLVDGEFSAELPVSDDPDLNPSLFTYMFEEAFIGGSTYPITLLTSLGATVDIVDLRPTTVLSPSYVQPVNADVWQSVVVRVDQEEEDLTSGGLRAEHIYNNLYLKYQTYGAISGSYSSYGALDNGEVRFTSAQVAALNDRITGLTDYTATSAELRETLDLGVSSGSTYGHLNLKLPSYDALTATYATYNAATNATQTFTYAQSGAIVNDFAKVMAGTGGISNAFLAAYADIIRSEANRPNKMLLIGV